MFMSASRSSISPEPSTRLVPSTVPLIGSKKETALLFRVGLSGGDRFETGLGSLLLLVEVGFFFGLTAAKIRVRCSTDTGYVTSAANCKIKVNNNEHRKTRRRNETISIELVKHFLVFKHSLLCLNEDSLWLAGKPCVCFSVQLVSMVVLGIISYSTRLYTPYILIA